MGIHNESLVIEIEIPTSVAIVADTEYLFSIGPLQLQLNGEFQTNEEVSPSNDNENIYEILTEWIAGDTVYPFLLTIHMLPRMHEPLIYGENFKIHNSEAQSTIPISIIELSSKQLAPYGIKLSVNTLIEFTFYIKNMKVRDAQINDYPCSAGMDYPPMEYDCVHI